MRDRLLQVVAANEPHGVEGPTVSVGAQAIHRHDARVLQAARDFSFQQKADAAVKMVGELLLDLLESHLAAEFFILRHEDFAQAALGMRSQNAKPRAGRRTGAGGWDDQGAEIY